MTTRSIWFVTPAWQRFALTEACLAQRREVIDQLEMAGIEGRCVVVADDENLELARAAGFDTVERDNQYLGRRFNDGMEYAGQHGADWIVPIGSDSWIDPGYFTPLPPVGETRTSAIYCAATGSAIGELRVAGNGAGPYMFPRAALRRAKFRPADDRLARGIDGSTISGIERHRPVVWTSYDLHPFQYVGFRGEPLLNSFDRLYRRWGVARYDRPWEILARYYSAKVIAMAQKALA